MEAEWRRFCGDCWRELGARDRRQLEESPGMADTLRLCGRLLRLKEMAILAQLSAQYSTQKDPAVELEFKQRGNAQFRLKDYAHAVALYSKGLHHSSTHSPQAALLYANRSAALYQLQRYQECLVDIERAQEHNYPHELLHKILARRAACLQRLGQADGASDLCSREHLSARGRGRARMQNQATTEGAPCGQTKTSGTLCEISPSIAVRSDSSRGRHLVATEELRPGEVLLQEEAFTAVLIPEGASREPFSNEDVYCHHCLEGTELPVPCLTCSFSSYCSELCREQAWNQYHWLECGLGGFLFALGTFTQLALRTVLLAGIQEVQRAEKLESGPDQRSIGECSVRHNPDHKVELSSCFSGMSGVGDGMPRGAQSRYQMIHSLLTHTRLQTPEHRFLCGLTAAAVCQEIRRMGLESRLVEQDAIIAQDQGLRTLGVALLQHLLQLECNAQAITALRVTGGGHSHVAEMEEVRIATAFYCTASLLNHSCEPNTSVTFHNTTIIVRASQHIAAGQEVLHCYGPHWSRMAVRERQQALRSQYFFHCQCTACVREEGDVGTDSVPGPFLCSHCGVALQDSKEAHCTCPNSSCRLKVSKQALFQQVKTVREQIGFARHLSTQHPDQALRLLSECQQLACTLVSDQHPLQGEIQDCLAQTHASQGDWLTAARHMRKSKELVRIQYGAQSVELGKELFKLAQLLFNGHVVDEALNVTEQAENLLLLHCGAEHEMVVELRAMKSCLQTLPSQFARSPKLYHRE
ncbi:SET and MYND domain-containing protein 4 [Hemiscyllium ocellatum]|uniref:SET and MYND domain-containing protein 4 n=1 Tax=Hemiscyllium ocellatum TaxID=170820 RepID=UPI002965FD00|nr:SET and MYND domain-containing protein 4 [Hemiscyllium ocellatum]